MRFVHCLVDVTEDQNEINFVAALSAVKNGLCLKHLAQLHWVSTFDSAIGVKILFGFH